MGKYSTISQLAESLGVSPSTVSRALKDHPKISKKTKQRIWEKAKEAGFYPNRYADVLRNNQTYLIGVLVPDLTLPFFSRVLSGIDSYLKGTGYSIVLGHSEENLEKEIELIDQFIMLRVDGVIAALSKESGQTQHFEKLLEQEIPLVFYDRVVNFLNVPRIVSNDYQAAYNAAEYLIKSGCRRIAHITASKNLNNSNNRLYGYMDALKNNGMDVNEELIYYFEFDHSTIERFLNDVLQTFPDLDGIFGFNDFVANTTINYLMKKGKKIPEEISVIGFSDEPIATYMTPQLSTVEDIAPAMGKEAGMAMLKLLKKQESVIDKIILDQNLILRQTTKNEERSV